jgi:hypothetical protein
VTHTKYTALHLLSRTVRNTFIEESVRSASSTSAELAVRPNVAFDENLCRIYESCPGSEPNSVYVEFTYESACIRCMVKHAHAHNVVL